jgi:hypothetical protein
MNKSDEYTLGDFNREYVPFPELGSGSQFHAYDLHNDRVLKLPLTKGETSVVVARRHHNMNPLSNKEQASVDARVQTVVNGKARIPGMVRHSFYDPKPFLKLIGNPVLLDVATILPEETADKQWGAGRVVYTQDKLNMVGKILRTFAEQPRLSSGDIAQLKSIIDMYVEQTYHLWEYGFADYVFKIGDTGFNSNNELVFADIGECSSDPVFIRKVLKDRRWLHSTISDKIDFPQIPDQVREYYIETLDAAFTDEAFMARWRTKHRCSTCGTHDDAITAFIAAKVDEIDYVDRW